MRIALFVTCLGDTLFPRVRRGTVSLLERLGREGGVSRGRDCSAQMARHTRRGPDALRLLRHVGGIELVALPDADVCCGFGGTFALKNADTSTAILADKMRNIAATGAEACTAGDSSCLMHIGGGLSRLRAGVQTVHLAEILASARQTA